jgi:uncharacterized protein (TIGR02996 family)
MNWWREAAMNEREALLRAVCDNPDDDTPRLVFADWLQENGDEARAEFIRAQIELLRHDRYTIPWFKCQTRARKRLAAHEARWRSEVPSDTGLEWWREFRRGFLEQLIVSDIDVFDRLADPIFTATPLLEVRLHCRCRLSALSRIPHLARLSVVSSSAVDCTVEEAGQLVAALARHRLTRFDLVNGVVDADARRILVDHFGSVIRFPIT